MKLKEVMTSMDYEKLYKAYYLQVYSYTISLAKNREIAEEITQNTFYKAVSTTSQFKGKSDELTWIWPFLSAALQGTKMDETQVPLTQQVEIC